MSPVQVRRVFWAVLGILVLWLLLGALVGPYAGKLSDVQRNDNAAFLPASAESTRVEDLRARFEDRNTTPAIVVYQRTSGVTAADQATIMDDLAAIRKLPDVGEVSPPIRSDDGRAVEAIVQLTATDGRGLADTVAEIRDLVRGETGLQAYVTGPAGLLADLLKAFEGIDTTLLAVSGIVVIIILLFVYRSPVLWVVPLLSVGMAYALSAGIVYFLADHSVLKLNGQSQGILTVLVFGAGTDYALLLIARYREELRRHESRYAAMGRALRGAGPAIIASGSTVVLGLLCLLFSELSSNKSLGPVSAIGIVCTMLAMLTFLPALLLLVGRRLFWPFVPRYGSPSHETTGLWGRVARLVEQRSRTTAAVASLALLTAALGVVRLEASGIAQTETFTSAQESVTGQDALGQHFPAGSGSPAVIISNAAQAAEVLAAAKATRGVADAAFRTAAAGGAPPGQQAAPGPSRQPKAVAGRVEIDATLADPPDSRGASATIERLRSAVHEIPGADALVGGFTAVDLDNQHASQRDRVVIIPIVLAVIFVVLTLLLRALVAPVLLIATVVLSFVATLGICALVFRHVFRFAGEDSAFPLFAFVFLVALGIDYNIFLMSRVREETIQLGTRPGTLRGLAVTGGVITSAGIVLAATFSVLGILPLVFLAEIGFAVAFGVLLDTIVVRSLLVPALVYAIGQPVWWPGALARRAEPAPQPLEPVPLGAVSQGEPAGR